MYYEYWGLNKPPFDNVPDPTMYAECHSSMESTIAETLFAIEEGEDCVAVIVGDVGLGKTTSIRIIIDSLDQEKYKIALITNPSTTFVQILREVIGQLTGEQCEEKKKVDLLEIFNKLLFKTVDEGKKILIFIDEANAISPANLESLRLLTNMQCDQKNLFTMVLAGQMELARRLEHPNRANLFQRIGTYSRIDKIHSEDLVKSYVETRLRLAGGTRNIFTDDAFGYIWMHSEHGIPRLINKLCKLSLKAGETNELNEINGEVVNQVGERFQKISSPCLQKRRPRKRVEEKSIPVPATKVDDLAENITVGQGISEVEIVNQQNNLLEIQTPLENRFMMKEGREKIDIGETNVWLEFTSDFIEKVHSSNEEKCMELAGVMAAQTLRGNPQLTESPLSDPVYIWEKIKDYIVNKISQEKNAVV
ncbi:MAG: AAA family ATPase [Candidatus Scalindua sp.]|nr:AAA family ATPase [Candidatus Scalindua sp.]